MKHSRTKDHHEITQDLFAKAEILGEASLFQMNTTFSLQDSDLFRQWAFVAGRTFPSKRLAREGATAVHQFEEGMRSYSGPTRALILRSARG